MLSLSPRQGGVVLAALTSVGCATAAPSSLETTESASSAMTADGPKNDESVAAASRAERSDGKPSGAVLPDFTLDTVEGERFRLSDHIGEKVIVMSFWATWCNPCMTELPHLDEIYQDERDNGLLIVAVAMDEPGTVAQVGPTAARLGLTMPVVLDTDQRAVRLYNRSRDAPRTVVIDRSGTIVRSSAGYNPGDEDKLRAEVQTLLSK